MSNRQWIFVKRPSGPITHGQFEFREGGIPEPGDGEFLLRTLYMSCDPAMHSWMNGASYVAPLNPGDVMLARVAAQVVKSRHPKFAAGDIVIANTGWQDYAVTNGIDRSGDKVTKLASGVSIPVALNLLGSSGLTAYFGLTEVGKLRAGDTLLVSGAAGAVGSIAGQIGKIAGCRVIGIAGSDEKCRFVTEELGFDACINYRNERPIKALARVCPQGIDVFFDNVGGAILHAGFAHLAHGARVVICGGIAGYEDPKGNPGLTNYMQLVMKRARAEGFLVIDFRDRYDEGISRLSRWLSDGRIKSREDIFKGFETAPDGLIGLFKGDNIGKRLIHVADPQ